jgi:hypothetical protein
MRGAGSARPGGQAALGRDGHRVELELLGAVAADGAGRRRVRGDSPPLPYMRNL